MCKNDCIRHTHYKHSNNNAKKCYCIGEQKEECKCCRCRKHCCTSIPPLIPISNQRGKIIEEKPQSETVLQCLETTPKIIEAHNDSSHQTDNTVANVDPFPSNTTDNQGTRLPLTPDGLPVSEEHSEHNTHIMPSEKGQTVNRFMDAEDEKSCDQASGCGLLHYRKWWEKIEVDISVYGKLITGVPIFIEENTIRVINNDYSYFIPLEKVDYIRTTDGMHSCFNLSDGKPTNDRVET